MGGFGDLGWQGVDDQRVAVGVFWGSGAAGAGGDKSCAGLGIFGGKVLMVRELRRGFCGDGEGWGDLGYLVFNAERRRGEVAEFWWGRVRGWRDEKVSGRAIFAVKVLMLRGLRRGSCGDGEGWRGSGVFGFNAEGRRGEVAEFWWGREGEG